MADMSWHDMNTVIRAFDESTLADAKQVVSDMFSPKDCSLLDKMLANPLRKGIGESSAGEVVYQDGRPVAFQGAVLRRLYLGREPMVGIVGSTLCARRETSPILLMQLMKATIKARGGSTLFYANTSNVVSMKMNRMLGVKGVGPDTCARIRFTVVYVPPGLKWTCRRPHARRLPSIDAKMFNDFWTHYRETNEGIVSSRSAEELAWVFGDQLASGKAVLLGEFSGDSLVGYIVLKSSHSGRRWLISDWIAIKNDVGILDSLLSSAVRFLRRMRGAVLLESIGFPDFMDSVLGRYLRFSRKTKNNSFLWKSLDARTRPLSDSWFFGPYDGDRSM